MSGRLACVATIVLFLGVIVTNAAPTMPRPSAVRDGSKCHITDHGADPGADDNLKAINKAISDCADGGTVVVAGGAYMTSPIKIKDATNLLVEVQADSSLVAAHGPTGWPTDDDGYVPFIYFHNSIN